MKKIIHFHVSRGTKEYIAESSEIPVVTQGKTLDEITKNIEEAVELYFEGENRIDLGFEKQTVTLIDYELPVPSSSYATV